MGRGEHHQILRNKWGDTDRKDRKRIFGVHRVTSSKPQPEQRAFIGLRFAGVPGHLQGTALILLLQCFSAALSSPGRLPGPALPRRVRITATPTGPAAGSRLSAFPPWLRFPFWGPCQAFAPLSFHVLIHTDGTVSR